jgi:hypothetical protein
MEREMDWTGCELVELVDCRKVNITICGSV